MPNYLKFETNLRNSVIKEQAKVQGVLLKGKRDLQNTLAK
jgi:hypothetical protein